MYWILVVKRLETGHLYTEKKVREERWC